MNQFASIVIFLVAVGAVMLVVGLCRAYRRSTFIFSIVDKKGEVVYPKRRVVPVEDQGMPPIFTINNFLASFFASTERTITFAPGDWEDSRDPPLIKLLQGVDYETVRLRLRTICSLNPVVNREVEEGVIQMTTYHPDAQEMKFRAVFAPKGESISLEKLNDPRLIA